MLPISAWFFGTNSLGTFPSFGFHVPGRTSHSFFSSLRPGEVCASNEYLSLLLPPKAVCPLELIAQLRRAQVFAQVGQPLLQREQCRLHGPGIGTSDIAPHGVGARAQAGH